MSPRKTLEKLGNVPQYLATGVLVFGADYAVFFVCYTLFGLELALATTIAYVVGLVTNFALLRYWAFAASARRDYLATTTVKYALWLALNLGITYLMLKYLQLWADISPFVGKFVVAFFMTFWNYLGYKIWVFKGPRAHSYKISV